MQHKKILTILVFAIVVLALAATLAGIFTEKGAGTYEFTSIHGEEVLIYGKGIYRNMAAVSAPDGIAQDIVTLVLAIPLLIISFLWAKKGSLKGRLLFAGVVFYFLFTYLLYMMLIMYNELFLIYVALASLSFFVFVITMISFDLEKLSNRFNQKLPVRFIGGFLIFAAVAVGLNWLGRIVPPLLDGSIVPQGLEHYTTLPVQGLDLAFVLPTAFLSGVLLIKRNNYGYLMAPVFLNFLFIMMTAIAAKVFGQSLQGAEGVLPVLIVFSLFALTAAFCSLLIMRNLKEVIIDMIRVTDKTDMDKVLQLRYQVFVEEQGVSAAIERDNDDRIADHVLVQIKEEAVGCGRIVFKDDYGKIGRVAVAHSHRKKGIGSKVCRELIKIAKEKGCKRIILHAQHHSEQFYKKIGFKSVGDIFMEAGIKHIKMELNI
ncbi:MAG: GNAT family N-acetyltransferase [Halothermotrichaceae bacterium]